MPFCSINYELHGLSIVCPVVRRKERDDIRAKQTCNCCFVHTNEKSSIFVSFVANDVNVNSANGSLMPICVSDLNSSRGVTFAVYKLPPSRHKVCSRYPQVEGTSTRWTLRGLEWALYNDSKTLDHITTVEVSINRPNMPSIRQWRLDFLGCFVQQRRPWDFRVQCCSMLLW